MSHRKLLTGRRVVRKSTGGITPSIPEPVDPADNPAPLKSNTVAFVTNGQVRFLTSSPVSWLRKKVGGRARKRRTSFLAALPRFDLLSLLQTEAVLIEIQNRLDSHPAPKQLVEGIED